MRPGGLLVLLPLLLAMGAFEVPRWSGTVDFRGNEPFARLVLTDAAGRSWVLEGPAAADLASQAQGRRVTVEGRRAGKDRIEVSRWILAPVP